MEAASGLHLLHLAKRELSSLITLFFLIWLRARTPAPVRLLTHLSLSEKYTESRFRPVLVIFSNSRCAEGGYFVSSVPSSLPAECLTEMELLLFRFNSESYRCWSGRTLLSVVSTCAEAPLCSVDLLSLSVPTCHCITLLTCSVPPHLMPPTPTDPEEDDIRPG